MRAASGRPGRWFWVEASVSSPETLLKTCPAKRQTPDQCPLCSRLNHRAVKSSYARVVPSPRCFPRPRVSSCSSSCFPSSTGYHLWREDNRWTEGETDGPRETEYFRGTASLGRRLPKSKSLNVTISAVQQLQEQTENLTQQNINISVK